MLRIDSGRQGQKWEDQFGGWCGSSGKEVIGEKAGSCGIFEKSSYSRYILKVEPWNIL